MVGEVKRLYKNWSAPHCKWLHTAVLPNLTCSSGLELWVDLLPASPRLWKEPVGSPQLLNIISRPYCLSSVLFIDHEWRNFLPCGSSLGVQYVPPPLQNPFIYRHQWLGTGLTGTMVSPFHLFLLQYKEKGTETKANKRKSILFSETILHTLHSYNSW